jgi:hypothetical protein
MRLRPVEVLVLGYFGLMVIFVLASWKRVDGWQLLLAGYALFALLIPVLARAERRFPENRLISILRFACPVVALLFAYVAVARSVLILRGRFLDDAVNSWELSLFGAHPNVAIGAVSSPLLTELLTFCYFSFYGCFLIPVFLFARGRRPLAERYMFAVLLAAFTCYLGFLVVPLAGPSLSLGDRLVPAHLPGYAVTALQRHIMATFDPVGTCFPSSHVAVAWTTVLCLRPFLSRRARRVVCALTVGLTIAVVYDRYHYVSDAVAGLPVALGAGLVTRWLGTRGAFEPGEIGGGAPSPGLGEAWAGRADQSGRR